METTLEYEQGYLYTNMLDDILFLSGDNQNFINEVPAGTLNSPLDILSDRYMVNEIPSSVTVNAPVDILFDHGACMEFPAATGSSEVSVIYLTG